MSYNTLYIHPQNKFNILKNETYCGATLDELSTPVSLPVSVCRCGPRDDEIPILQSSSIDRSPCSPMLRLFVACCVLLLIYCCRVYLPSAADGSADGPDCDGGWSVRTFAVQTFAVRTFAAQTGAAPDLSCRKNATPVAPLAPV